MEENSELQLQYAQAIQYTLSEQNCLELLKQPERFEAVCQFACNNKSLDTPRYGRVCAGILAALCQVSEEMCKELTYRNCLDTILRLCRNADTETQRNSAIALANFALFAGPENHIVMIKHNVPEWLLFVGFNHDDHVRYLGCLATAALVANREIETLVLKQTTLNLVQPFISKHSARQFACSPLSRSYGQSKSWLKRLVSVLQSDKEDAKSLAAFHFAMVAHTRKGQKIGSVSVRG